MPDNNVFECVASRLIDMAAISLTITWDVFELPLCQLSYSELIRLTITWDVFEFV